MDRWKLRKDKLRTQAADAQSPTDEPAAGQEAEQEAHPLSAASDPGAQPQADLQASASETPIALGSEGSSPQSEALHLDKPAGPAPSPEAAADFGDAPALDPLGFAPSSDLDTAPAFVLNDMSAAPVFALDDLETSLARIEDGEDDAPVFGLGSVLDIETDEDAPLLMPLSSAFDPLPDDAADAFAMPGPAPIALSRDPIALDTDTDFTPNVLGSEPSLAPIALGGDMEGPHGAFAPYQPPSGEDPSALMAAPTDDDPYTDPDLEVGAMAFNPQSPVLGAFDPAAPTAGEEIAPETVAPDFADTQDTSAFAFEPAFGAPDALAGEAGVPLGEDAGDEPFMDRDALAAGLVTMEATTGLPRVAPFVPAGQDAPDYGEAAAGPYTLTLRLGGLSATYPLVKDVTTIGRPDSETNTYPDIEVDLDDGVSRRHAEVRQEDGSVYLVDMGSTNGTILNGEMLTAGRPAPLLRGDRIRIGERVEIVFE